MAEPAKRFPKLITPRQELSRRSLQAKKPRLKPTESSKTGTNVKFFLALNGLAQLGHSCAKATA